jgi:DinB superfamily
VNDQQTLLLRQLDEGWTPFWARVERLDSEALRNDAHGTAWSIALILAHCARWEDWSFQAVVSHLRTGAAPDMTGVESWNDRWASEDRRISGEEARRWLGESHGRLRELLVAMRPEQWDEVVSRTIEWCTFHHYGEHLSSLPA